jgi:DNA gyrase inhibitor GyrI
LASVVTTREKYQREALAVVRAAEVLRDPTERVHLLEIAGGYMALAKHAASQADETGQEADA